MPIGTYTMLKGTKPAFEEKASANYYAYGPSGSVATYKKISGLIKSVWLVPAKVGTHSSLLVLLLRAARGASTLA